MSVAKAGIKTLNSKTDLRFDLSPNPSSSQFKLIAHTVNNNAIQVKVLDVNGKIIYQTKGLPEQPITFGESWISGMYLIEVRQGDEAKILKAVKN